MQLSRKDIDNMEQRYRAALINSLTGFKPANLVGTADDKGHTNLAIISSAVHIGSNPPLIALVFRPGGEERHSLHNLLRSGHYSINHLHEKDVARGHQTAARYPRDVSEFDAAQFTPRWVHGFEAPLVEESPIRLGLELREHQELAINATHLVIGEIVLAELPQTSLRDDGSVDLVDAGSTALSGLDSYYRAQRIKRMAYAKPDQEPQELAQD